MQFNRTKVIFLTLATVGTLIISLSLFYFGWSRFARSTIIDQVVFRRGTEMWSRFNSTDDIKDLRLSFYVYSVKNPHETNNTNFRIRFEEIGPFTYDILRTKDFLSVNEQTGFITYKLRTRYSFNRALSKFDARTTKIVWPNIPLIVAWQVMQKSLVYRTFGPRLFNHYLPECKDEGAFITDTVDNFIISGSYREVFERVQESFTGKFIQPWPLPDNKFALLYNKNDRWDEKDPNVTVSAGFGGRQTFKNLNSVLALNGHPEIPNWIPQPPECSRLAGTDGQFFPPFLNSSSELYVYAFDLCRKIKLKYEHNIYLAGINTMSFSFDESNFLSYEKNPENECYCLERDVNNKPLPECSYDGLIDLSKCNQPGIVASTARFYGGSPELWKKFDGLEPPNAQDHLGRFLIEPNSGITLKVYTPLQFNVRLRKNPFSVFSWYKNNEPTIIPLTWVAQISTMSEAQAHLLNNKLILLDAWLLTTIVGGLVVFVAAVIAAVVLSTRMYRKSKLSRAVELGPRETDRLLPTQEHRVIENAAVSTRSAHLGATSGSYDNKIDAD